MIYALRKYARGRFNANRYGRLREKCELKIDSDRFRGFSAWEIVSPRKNAEQSKSAVLLFHDEKFLFIAVIQSWNFEIQFRAMLVNVITFYFSRF